MAGVAEKLYPPTIGSSMPAFYQENGAATIVVPFSMNRAVSVSDISGFRIKIKTVQSNTFIHTLESREVNNSITNREVRFTWSDISNFNIRLGQYLKIQMAYIGKDGTIGYFSTVGIAKYTSKPSVYIKRLVSDTNLIEPFQQTYTGVYVTSEDKSERPYAYSFFLYNFEKGLIETSGWKLHNTSVNNLASESLSLDEATDTYTFETLLTTNYLYYIQYAVRTINNLEIYSPMYSCMDPSTPETSFGVNLVATNNYEEAYVELNFSLKDKYTTKSDEELLAMYPEAVEVVTQENTDVNNNTSIIYKKFATAHGVNAPLLQDEEGNDIYYIYASLPKPISIEICRSSKLDNYESWQVLKKKYFTNYNQALSWSYKDFTIEQGITYKYCFRQYSENSVSSSRAESNLVMADFEDMFLWDGKKQLKIRFNPKVSSFKTTRFEQKIDTIGSKYPFIFRNGVVSYKEFPIAGLISYKADNNEMFTNAIELDLISNNKTHRDYTPVNQNYNDYSNEDNPVYSGKSWERSETLDSVGYNMRAERLFKLKLMDWLGNGKIKMFKSPQEGNYLVRLLNISLTPEDRLGRMLHNFSCTAYEMEELTYNNLLNLNFLNIADDEETNMVTSSILFKNKIAEITNIDVSVKINENDILNWMRIEPTVNGNGHSFFVRLGADSADNKVFISPVGLTFNAGSSFESQLPDVYFNIKDNLSLIEDVSNQTQANLTNLKNQCIDLVGDSLLHYKYNSTEILIGDFNNIRSIYIKNQISTTIGPNTLSFNYTDYSSFQVLKFFVLDFKEKVIKDIIQRAQNVYEDKDTHTTITQFDDISLYKIYDTNNNLLRTCYCQNGSLQTITNGEIKTTITLVDQDDNVFNFNEPPVLNLNDSFYKSIVIGNGIYLNCAYQVKITEYKS